MTSIVTISSQRHRDDEIVAEKQGAKDYDVLVSPEFYVPDWDATVRVILDGHHSLEAAKRDGAAPTFLEADAMDHDAVGMIARGDIEGFLEAAHIDDDYYDVSTGRDM